MKGLPWDAEDGIHRGRPRKESAPPPPILVGDNTQTHNMDLPDNTADKHSETPKETDDAKETDTAPMSETPVDDGRNASHMKSKSSLDNISGVRQRCELWCGDGDDSRPQETVRQGEIRESNTFLVSRLTRRRCDSRQNLEMAARVQSR